MRPTVLIALDFATIISVITLIVLGMFVTCGLMRCERLIMQQSSNLPDYNKCKTKLVSDDLWYCVTHYAYHCRYALRLGSEYYCDHSERHNFKIGDCSKEESNYGL